VVRCSIVQITVEVIVQTIVQVIAQVRSRPNCANP